MREIERVDFVILIVLECWSFWKLQQ